MDSRAGPPSNRPSTRKGNKSDIKTEEVNEDDICPVCQLLLCRPVTTLCKHTLCESCMATWADVSIVNQMQIVDVDEEPVPFNAVSGLEARCPMCRSQTTASLNPILVNELMAKYPRTYADRELEEREHLPTDMDKGEIQTLTLYIGNRHRLITPSSATGSTNKHEWTFFVRPSRTDIIEEVHVHLHPTFRPSHINCLRDVLTPLTMAVSICPRNPYEVRRIGWGYFTIVASVMLKAGYSWMSEDAEDSPDGAEKGMLSLEWLLDFTRFEGKGSMGRLKLKVKNQRAWEAEAGERRDDERAWSRLVRQYERDGRYVPREEM